MILVLAEHRRKKIRDVTFEMLAKGRSLASTTGSDLVAVLLGNDIQVLADELRYHAGKVLVIEDESLENFNSEVYQKVLSHLIANQKLSLTLIGHTSFGIELAPSLATELGSPLVMDCLDLAIGNEGLIIATRQIYGGKLNCRVCLKGNHCIATLRPAAFMAGEKTKMKGEIIRCPFPLHQVIQHKRFIGYVEAPTGDIDITQADLLVAVGRGIKKQEDIKTMEDFATSIGGVLACSRPIVDRGWLPHERQVGTSGKTVKAKLYIAIGISGASQHTGGMSSCDTIIAINEDQYAPILSIAHYAILDDLYKVMPVLNEKIHDLKK